MQKRNISPLLSLSALLLAALCLLSVSSAAQEPAAQNLGAPLKGVDVKLGRNPGGLMASRTTDQHGKFDFGVLPAGSYYLIVSLPKKTNNASDASTAARESNPSLADTKTCLIIINGATAGTINMGWDFERSRTFDPAAQSAARATDQERIAVVTDGTHPLNGTIVKSKSNITNN